MLSFFSVVHDLLYVRIRLHVSLPFGRPEALPCTIAFPISSYVKRVIDIRVAFSSCITAIVLGAYLIVLTIHECISIIL